MPHDAESHDIHSQDAPSQHSHGGSTHREFPDSLELCHELLRVKDEEVRTLQRLAEQLAHEVQLLKRCIFGSRRERFTQDPNHPLLPGFATQLEQDPPSSVIHASGQPAEDAEPAPPKRKSRHRGRRVFPDFLPRQRTTLEVPEDQRACPSCHAPRVRFSEKVSSQVEYVPSSLFVREIVRPNYHCPCCESGEIIIAPLPPQPIDRCVAGPGLLAHVAVSKYTDHLPLNRTEDILARAGWHVPRSTLCDWMAGVARCLRVLWEVMRRRLQGCRVLGLDDTYVDLLEKRRTTTRQTRFWVAYGDLRAPYVLVAYHETRTRAGPDQLITTFGGVLQGDAYSVHQQVVESSRGRIQYAGCWAHARRGFEQLPVSQARDGHHALALIRMLYDVEDRGSGLSPADRLALRERESRALMLRLQTHIEEQRRIALPRSEYGEALGYVANQWSTLQVYLENGEVPLDNNRTEESLRPMTRGRDAWLFVGSPRGGQTAATIYSFTATCRRLLINPQLYLADVLKRIPEIVTAHGLDVGCDLAQLEVKSPEAVTDLERLLPDAWLEAHPEARLTHRDRERSQSRRRRNAHRASRRELATP